MSRMAAPVENRDMNGDQLLEIVTKAYLGSRDFNGFSFSRAAQTLPELDSLTETVSGLVEAQRLELLFDGADEYPAVKRFRVAPRSWCSTPPAARSATHCCTGTPTTSSISPYSTEAPELRALPAGEQRCTRILGRAQPGRAFICFCSPPALCEIPPLLAWPKTAAPSRTLGPRCAPARRDGLSYPGWGSSATARAVKSLQTRLTGAGRMVTGRLPFPDMAARWRHRRQFWPRIAPCGGTFTPAAPDGRTRPTRSVGAQ
jgi:hypothetical protein